MNAVFRVGPSELACFGVVECLETAVDAAVDLRVHEGTIIFQPFECVAGVAVLLMITVGSTTVTEQDHDLMNALWVLGEIVPKHVGIFEMGLGVTLLGVNEVGELGGIANEKDGGVVEYPIPVAFVSAKLDRETTGIASGVGRARFATDSRETNGSADFGAGRGQELVGGYVGEIMGNFEDTMRSSAFGVDLAKAWVRLWHGWRQIRRTTRSGIRSRSKCASRSMW